MSKCELCEAGLFIVRQGRLLPWHAAPAFVDGVLVSTGLVPCKNPTDAESRTGGNDGDDPC